MAGRWLLGCALLGAGLAHAVEGEVVTPATPPPFAAGSVIGPWAFLELGTFLGAGTFVDPAYYGYAGLWTTASAGWGFEAGRVHLRPSARFSLVGEMTLPDVETGQRVTVSPVALSLAATNLLDEPHTGLRLTPAVGLTIPTAYGPSMTLTTLSAALQLERRFGPFEIGLRSELAKPINVAFPSSPCSFCAGGSLPNVTWLWVNSLQAEGWITPALSVGLGFAYSAAWRASAAADPNDPFTVQPRDSNGNLVPSVGLGRSDRMTGRLFATWAFTRLFGLSLDVSTTQTPSFIDNTGVQRVRFPFLSIGNWNDNATVVFLGFNFRTDVSLARNWIER